jgi:hypothetical protein
VPFDKISSKKRPKSLVDLQKTPYNHGYKKLCLPRKGSASLKTTPLTQYLIYATGPANAGNDAENLACKVSYLWQNWLQIQVVRQEMSKAAEAAIGATWSGGQFWTLLEAGSLLQGLIK